jgi:phosphate transport system substrate-binding protein
MKNPVFRSFSILSLAFVLFSIPAQAEIIRGSGSTAAARLYQSWGEAFARTGHQLQYEATGSSAGLKALLEGKVDFGATDVPLSEAQLRQDNLVQIPTAITGIVPAINLPGVARGKLRLTGPVYADILGGRIRKWDDEAIRKLNPGLSLPGEAIRVVAREDGSGSTYVLSQYLSEVSADWKSRFGTDYRLAWPEGTLKAKGSSGVAKLIGETPFSIGYLESGSIDKAQLNYAQLANRAGQYLHPTPESFQAALSSSNWTFQGRFEESLSNLGDKAAWPITTGTFVIMKRTAQAPQRMALVLNFFSGAFMQADKLVPQSGYVALPIKTQARAVKSLASISEPSGVPMFFDVIWRVKGAS